MMNDKEYAPNDGQEEELTLAEDDFQDDDEALDDAFEAERAELNDKILRLAAELENTRRRAERDKADAGRYAIANFARDLLGVADNFERALQAVGDDGDNTPASETLTGLLAGLRMTEKELLTVLERHGVHRVAPAGEKFDPNLHQAVAQTPSDTVPSGHVVDVVQSGFTIGDRVLRAAIVTVSTGAAKGGGNGATAGGQVDTEA